MIQLSPPKRDALLHPAHRRVDVAFLHLPFVAHDKGRNSRRRLGQRQCECLGQPNASNQSRSSCKAMLDDQASRDRLRHEREELDQLRKAKIETLQNRLFIRVLEIDPDNGNLVYHQDNQRWEIASEADMQRLTERQRRAAGTRVLYYLLLYPRRITGFPERRQIQSQYERWLSDVAHGFDNPAAWEPLRNKRYERGPFSTLAMLFLGAFWPAPAAACSAASVAGILFKGASNGLSSRSKLPWTKSFWLDWLAVLGWDWRFGLPLCRWLGNRPRWRWPSVMAATPSLVTALLRKKPEKKNPGGKIRPEGSRVG